MCGLHDTPAKGTSFQVGTLLVDRCMERNQLQDEPPIVRGNFCWSHWTLYGDRQAALDEIM